MTLSKFIKNLEQSLICQEFIENCEDTTLIKASICTWIELLAKRLEVKPADLAKTLTEIITEMNQ